MRLHLSFEDYNSKIDSAFNEKRLGKLVEQFVFAQLNVHPNIHKVIQNIQIIENKITLGELDCLFQYLNEYVHLEIVYKFYVYDELSLQARPFVLYSNGSLCHDRTGCAGEKLIQEETGKKRFVRMPMSVHSLACLKKNAF